MKLKAFLICSICLLSLCQLYSQTQLYSNRRVDIVDISQAQTAVNGNSTIPENVQGSPYVDDNYSLVKISITGDNLYKARFNAYNGNMEIEHEGKTIALNVSEDIEVLFTNENKLYKTYDYKQEGSKETERGFLVVLKNLDSIDLLKKENIKFSEKKVSKSTYGRDTPAQFTKQASTYYIRYKGEAVYLPTRKRDFLEFFSDYTSELKTYMKKNDLNPKNEDDLIALINHLDILMKKK